MCEHYLESPEKTNISNKEAAAQATLRFCRFCNQQCTIFASKEALQAFRKYIEEILNYFNKPIYDLKTNFSVFIGAIEILADKNYFQESCACQSEKQLFALHLISHFTS